MSSRFLRRTCLACSFLLFALAAPLSAGTGIAAGPWWTWRNPLPQGNVFNDVAYADGLYVAGGRGGSLFTSSDGTNWISRVSGVGHAIRFLIHGNGVWLATAGDRVLTSTDGTTWFVAPAVNPEDPFQTATFFRGRFLAATARGRIWSSSDGLQWTIALDTAGGHFTGIAASPDRAIALGIFQGKLTAVTSTDGTTWADAASALAGVVPESYSNKPVVWCHDRWFLLGANVLHSSTDGVTWTKSAVGFVPNDIAYRDGRWVVAADQSAAVSSDLATWTAATVPIDGAARYVRAVTAGPAGFVMVGGGGTIATSADGSVWINHARYPVADNFRKIAHAGDRWLVAGDEGVYSSSDGISWSKVAAFAQPDFGSATVAYGAGIALAGCRGAPLLRSTDQGTTWSPVAGAPAGINQLAYHGGFVAVASGRQFYTSPDGLVWTAGQELPVAAGHFTHLAFHAGKWIALGNRAGMTQDAGVVATSTDGLTWTVLPDDTLPARSYALAAGGGLVVASPLDRIYPYIYTSVDGTAWKQAAVLPYAAGPVMALGHTTGGFVGLTAFGYTVFSRDGIDWSATPSTGEYIYNDILEGPDSTLAVGNINVILQSGTSRFVANATRATTANTEDVLIAGFVITGTDETKRVLIRGLGPSLADRGVEGALADPELILFRDGERIAANTGWRTAPDPGALATAARQAGAAPLAENRADSALLLDLPPGIYTAHVRSGGSTNGVALVEVFEVGTSRARVVAIATRANVKTGSAVAIPGMVITGDSPKRVLIRAVGPTLRELGVGAVLARPRMTLHLGGRPVAANTGWTSAADPAAIAEAGRQVGAYPFPEGNADSALLVTLNPGIYTTVVEGADGGSGVAVLEVFEVE